MNINRKLQKIGRDLQEVAMEIGGSWKGGGNWGGKFRVARSPEQYRVGDYIRVYNDEGHLKDKSNKKFLVGLIIDKPQIRLSEGFTDMDGNMEELWEVEIIYRDEHHNPGFYKTFADWIEVYSSGHWELLDADRKKVMKPKNWYPPHIGHPNFDR